MKKLFLVIGLIVALSIPITAYAATSDDSTAQAIRGFCGFDVSDLTDEQKDDLNDQNKAMTDLRKDSTDEDILSQPLMDESEEITDEAVTSTQESTFQTSDTNPSTKSSAETNLPKLVDLGSDTCIPCQEMAPILEALKKEYEGIIDVEVVDVYEDQEKTDEYYAIHPLYVIPTQILFDENGNEVWSHEGSLSKDELIKIFSETLGIN